MAPYNMISFMGNSGKGKIMWTQWPLRIGYGRKNRLHSDMREFLG